MEEIHAWEGSARYISTCLTVAKNVRGRKKTGKREEIKEGKVAQELNKVWEKIKRGVGGRAEKLGRKVRL